MNFFLKVRLRVLCSLGLWTVVCGLWPAPPVHAELKSGMDADVVIGQPDFYSNSSGAGRNKLNRPTGIFSDGKKLFVADEFNHRVLIYNSIPTSNYAPADIVLGQPDFETVTPSTSQTKMNFPTCAFYDGQHLIVADFINNRVLVYNSLPTRNGAPADFVLGKLNFQSNGLEATETGFSRPRRVFSDGKRLFIVDQNNGRILIYKKFPTRTGALPDLVIGQTNFTSFTLGTSRQRLNQPGGVYFDGTRLFVSDILNHRVLIYNLSSANSR